MKMKKLIFFLSLVLSLFIMISPVFGQGSDLRVRNLYVYRGVDGRGGVPLWWDGFIYGQYAGTTRDCVFYNYTGSGQYLMRLQGDGANVFTIDKSGNVVAAGTISGAIAIPDTDASNYLSLVWNEDDIADRTLNFLVSGGNRSLTLQNNLTVEALSLVNQDLTTDASPIFAGLSLSDGNITNVGDIALDSISSDSGTIINVNLGSDAGDDFLVDTNKFVVEGDTGNIGINTTTPLGRVDIVGAAPKTVANTGLKNLLVRQTSAITSDYDYNILSEFAIDPATNSSGYYFGLSSEIGPAAGNSVDYSADITGVQGEVDHYGTGSLNRVLGTTGFAVNWSTGTIDKAYGGAFEIFSFSTGTITDAYTVSVSNQVHSGTIVNKVGIAIEDMAGATNNTELLIGTNTIPAGDFAIYNASTADSYFVGSVGIGVTPTIGKLHLERTSIDSPAGYRSGGFFKQNVLPTNDHAGNSYMYALVGYGYVPLASTKVINRVVGVEGWAENYGSGSVARLLGTSGWAYNDKNVTVTDIWGTYNIATSNDGTVSSLIGEKLFVSSFGGSVTDNIGLHIDDVLINGSTVTNRYGIKIDPFTGSTTTLDYAIYSEATQDSYIKGKFGLNTTTPTAMLTTRAETTIGSATQTGAGLDDLTSGGTFTGGLALDYDVYIDQADAVQTVDTIGQPTGALNNGSYTGVTTTKTGGGGDDNLTIDVTVAGGVVTVITVNVGGNGYAIDDTITLTGLSGAGGGGNDDGTFDVASIVDTFKWSDDGGSTWDVEKVEMTGAAQTLNNGVTVTFGVTVGHTVTDYWEFSATVIQPFLVEDESGNDLVTILNNGTMKLIHTVDTHYTDFQVDGSGDLTAIPSGGDFKLQSAGVTTLTIESTGDNAILSLNPGDVNADDTSINFYDHTNTLRAKVIFDSSAQDLLFTNIQTSSGADLVFKILNTTEAMRIWSGAILGNSGWIQIPNALGINTSGPDRKLDVLDSTAPQIRLTHTDGTIYSELQADGNGDLVILPSGNEVDITQDAVSTTLDISAYHDTEATTPTITMRKADNTKASPAPVDIDAVLGTVNFNGYDDDSFDNGARIYAKAAANWGAAERGTELYFSTRDGNGALTDQLKITADGHIRAGSSEWYKTEHLGAIDLSPGGSGAVQVTPDANTLGGYNLDADGEYLYFTTHVHEDWDGASDILLDIHFECDVNNGGGLVTDDAEFDLLCYYKEAGETVNKTQTPTVVIVVGQSARYKLFEATITIDYDLGGNVVDAGDIIAMRINFDASNSDIADVVLTHLTFKYQTVYVNEEI